MNEQRITYTCDPELNTQCNKQSCFIFGGNCRRTAHLEFAKQPVEKVRLDVPMSQEDFDSLTAESKPNKVHHHPKRKGGKR